jgi:sec-independent protein translocase protein TatA
MFGLNPVELVVIGVVAVLLFGNKLPNVARSMGKSLTEFKRGLQDLKEELNVADARPTQVRRYHEIDDREEATAPKFEPPVSEPTLEHPSAQGDYLADAGTNDAGHANSGGESRADASRADASRATVPPEAGESSFGA